MEVRLHHASGSWTCKIALRFEMDSDGRPVETVREVPFGEPLTNPNDVEDALRRAQLAILNPSIRDPKVFLNLTPEEVQRGKEGTCPPGSDGQLSFSENLICLDIAGPQITDLAFLDLPGIIANSDQPRDIELIESMVKKYITGNCLILLTVTMRDDYQNQKAVLLANQADPEGKRTIGVLTKPDTLQNGEHASWLDLIEGRKHRLRSGFFVTKQPAPEDLKKNWSFEEARAAEKAYFRQAEPWNTLDHGLRGRLGTGNLTAFLSDHLGRLPSIREDLAASLSTVEASLDRLPAPPSSDPVAELHKRLGALRNSLDRLVAGAPDFERLIRAKVENDTSFRKDLDATEPLFIPFSEEATDEIDDWLIDNNAGLTASMLAKVKQGDSALELVLQTKCGLCMTLDAVQSHIQKHKSREVPLNTPYGAKSALMTDALKPWPRIVHACLEGLRGSVDEGVKALIDRHFGESSNAELSSMTLIAVSEVIDALFHDAKARLNAHLELETIPYTQSSSRFSQVRDDTLGKLKKARHPTKLPAVGSAGAQEVRNALAVLAQYGAPNLNAADAIGRLMGPDPYEESLEAMAQTTAYFFVAKERTIDLVPMIIDAVVIRSLPSAVSDKLLERLLCNGDRDEAARLMAERPDIAEQRAELNLRRSRLEEAKKVLSTFGRGL
ncbi:hypothetical protein JCM3770_005359 [Rhodotorula araucariae]